MRENEAPLGSVAIQLLSSHNPHLLGFPEVRKALSDEISDLWVVRWLPPFALSRRNEFGASESTTILLYLLGISFFSLVKPFVEEIAKEAGKDFWKGIKKLVSKVHKKQCEHSYNLYSTIYVICELRDEFVAIEFELSSDKARSAPEITEDQIEEDLNLQILGIASSWDEIQTLIKTFQVGKTTEGPSVRSSNMDIHVIRHEGDGKWVMRPEKNIEFFSGIRPREPGGREQ